MSRQSTLPYFLALLISALFASACSILNLSAFTPTITPLPPSAGNSSPQAASTPRPGNVSINYTAADVDRAEALWESKQVNSYQIEVWAGGITPPPPVYIVQVWQDRVVYAARKYTRDGVHTPEVKSLATDAREVQAVTVPGLFAQAREMLTDAKKDPGPGLAVTIRVEFDKQWGMPNKISQSANCPDCVSYCDVQKFVPYDSADPPPTPTSPPSPTSPP